MSENANYKIMSAFGISGKFHFNVLDKKTNKMSIVTVTGCKTAEEAAKFALGENN